MNKNYNSLLKKITIFTVCALFSFAMNAQVGIGTTSPNSQLDILAPAATGNGLEVTTTNAANGSSAAWIKNNSTGYGLHAQNLLTTGNAAVLRALQLGTGTSAHGILITMNGTTVSGTTGLFVDQLGLGIGSFTNMGNAASASSGSSIQHAGSGDGMSIFQNGTGVGIYNQVAGNYGVFNVLNSNTIGTINLMTAGGTGEYIDLEVNDGRGVGVVAVDNIGSPTTGGDVFAFDGTVYTNTPSGALVNGAVLSGEQLGVGHGAIINHSGTAGRNAEFNITNAANTDAAIFSVHEGQGSAILAQNQNNIIAGTVYVGDFSYTGSDINDHIGVSGYSQPAAGWGIGVLGQGGWYGHFSLGNTGATGVKAFTIDHPEDPANKILKHFSIESNEVLNIYRGTEVFDGNGKAIASLPDYYDSVNKNPSYQLTPIGAAMPNLYVESEIGNGQFVIAGGVPNKKVSWQITAERNDPYLQQNPEQREAVLVKDGERRGKYLSPELYNQPKEKGLFYNTNRKKQVASKINKSNTKQLEKVKTDRAELPERTEPKVVNEEEQVKSKQ